MKNEEGLDPQTYTVLGIEFQQYSLKEIKKLSVKEITNPQGHDSLQNCNRGGLYDPDLGENFQYKYELCVLSYC